jgi:hypothetical protein
VADHLRFFAYPTEAQRFHAWLLHEFSGLTLIPACYGHPEELHPLAVEAVLGETGQPLPQTLLLVPRWARERVIIESTAGAPESAACCGPLAVRLRASPVIEYIPCILDAAQEVLRVGRLSWWFEGAMSPGAERQLLKTFGWIHAHSQRLPREERFHLFPEAAQKARWLEPWIGVQIPNPFWRSHQSRENRPG